MSEATDAVLDAAEKSLDEIEERLDHIDVVEIVRNNPKVLAAVGVLGLIAGGVGGYFYAKRTLRRYYEDLSSQEIAEAKQFYANLNKVTVDGEPLTPQQVMDQLHGEGSAEAALLEYQGRPLDEQDEALAEKAQARIVEKGKVTSISLEKEADPAHGVHPIEVVRETEDNTNVFIDPNFDLEEEMKYRTSDKPYIITHDEFFEGEKDYDQESVTYYEVDDTLTNDQDKPIDDINNVVGDDHLVRFGAGSKDKNIVYVRNDRLGIDYEITKSTGSYLEEVLGMPDDEPDRDG